MKRATIILSTKLIAITFLLAVFSACKYQQVQPASYPSQLLYMATATGANGIYTINTVPAPPINGLAGSGTFKFTVDATGNKLNIPLAVLRSGVNLDGSPAVNITANTDTLNKLVSKGALSNTTALPADKFTLTPSVTVPAGQTTAPFNLAIDFPYLLANTDKLFAFAVTISSSQGTVNPKLNTTVLLFDAKLLKPMANFTASVNTTTKAVTFTNTSTYAISSSWNFGDGSAASTTTSPVYTYAQSGTYNVTLTATGVAGSQNASMLTKTVVIP